MFPKLNWLKYIEYQTFRWALPQNDGLWMYNLLGYIKFRNPPSWGFLAVEKTSKSILIWFTGNPPLLFLVQHGTANVSTILSSESSANIWNFSMAGGTWTGSRPLTCWEEDIFRIKSMNKIPLVSPLKKKVHSIEAFILVSPSRESVWMLERSQAAKKLNLPHSLRLWVVVAALKTRSRRLQTQLLQRVRNIFQVDI